MQPWRQSLTCKKRHIKAIFREIIKKMLIRLQHLKRDVREPDRKRREKPAISAAQALSYAAIRTVVHTFSGCGSVA